MKLFDRRRYGLACIFVIVNGAVMNNNIVFIGIRLFVNTFINAQLLTKVSRKRRVKQPISKKKMAI